jgi:hypothetical protein
MNRRILPLLLLFGAALPVTSYAEPAHTSNKTQVTHHRHRARHHRPVQKKHVRHETPPAKGKEKKKEKESS